MSPGVEGHHGAPTRILKFGGTSLADPDRVRRVVGLVATARQSQPVVVVVSAFGGVTDDLVAAADEAARKQRSGEARIEGLARRHRSAARDLATAHEVESLLGGLDELLDELADLLRGITLIGECTPRTRAVLLSFGERFAAPIVAAAFRSAGMPAEAIDARGLVVTDDTYGNARVDASTTRERVRAELDPVPAIPVVTGFIAATPGGETTTLGRSGSDYTATLLGAALDADEVEIWTDVDGVMSADPRLVPEAFSLDQLGYAELMELSHWGARVMHPGAAQPARGAGIPIRIKNTFNPDFKGTLVVDRAPTSASTPVRGIASINQVTLMRLEGPGLQGVPGIAQRLFGPLAHGGISVMLITQASSERSICFAIEPEETARAVRLLTREFALEMDAGLVDPLAVETGCSVVAAVGESMREVPGISGRLFGVLGHHRINVRAIAQGSSELNISLVLAQEDEARALRAMHSAFFQETDGAQIFLAGVGRVGQAFLDQLAGQADSLASQSSHLRLAGVARSRIAAVDPSGLPLREWHAALSEGGATFDSMLGAALASDHGHRVFVDCTASADVASTYERLLSDGIAVVTANKLAFSESAARFARLRELGARGMGLYFETTVGAGLPLIRTVDDLIKTGDRVHRIEGLLSGTLGFLFYRVMQGARFSEALREADVRGFTEPDPREDLGGRDVARKLVILGRVAGLALEPEEVQVGALLPDAPWAQGSVEEFWQGLPEVDDHFESLRTQAAEHGGSLAYLGRIENGVARVDLVEIPAGHPGAGLGGSDNLVAVTTDRYRETPLVVQGPGAGPDVTAAGVFADVLRALAEAP